MRREFLLVLLVCSVVLPSVSAQTSVKVELHESATLPCSERCSGVARWTVSREPGKVLAQCDQTSCRSEEGFEMIHDQFLKGDLSLTIPDVDFSKRTWYTCDCDGKDLCDVSLRLEPPEFVLQKKPEQSLALEIPVSEPVKVTFARTGDANPNAVNLCEVEGRKVQCDPAYEARVLFTSSLQLNQLKDSDGGVYTIMDTKNEEIVSTYRITVREEKKSDGRSDVWMIWQKYEFYVGLVVGGFLGVLLLFFVLPQMRRSWIWLRRKTQRGGANDKTTVENSPSAVPEEVPLKNSSSSQ